MKDRRIEVFRSATFALIESLDAVVRLSRWRDADATPEPLRLAVDKLVDRLGAANRLAAGKFNGNIGDTSKVNLMCGVMRRLDTAYVTYRKEVTSAPAAAADALEVELGAASAGLGALAP